MFRLSKFFLPSLEYKLKKDDTRICSSDFVHQKRKDGTHAMIGEGEHLTRIRLGGDTLDEKTDKLYSNIIKEENIESCKKKILGLWKKNS